jgi:hypothetical protein
MKIRVLLTVAVLCVCAIGVGAQGRPDFSGTWEMDVERTRAETRARSGGSGGVGGGSMSAGGGGSMTSASGAAPAVIAVRITQTPATLTIDRISGQIWEKVVHTLDGSESVSVNGRVTIKLKSRWDGARLVSEGTNESQLSDGSGSVGGTLKEVRWIGKDGVMVIESTRVINAPPNVQVSNAGKPTVSVQYFTRK